MNRIQTASYQLSNRPDRPRMESNPVSGAGTQVLERQTGTASQTGPARLGQRHLFHRPLRLRVAFTWPRSSGSGERLLSPVEPGLDLDVHSRRPARLVAQDRGAMWHRPPRLWTASGNPDSSCAEAIIARTTCKVSRLAHKEVELG